MFGCSRPARISRSRAMRCCDAAIDEPEVRQLQRHLALDGAVGALGQPHRGRAALPELAQQAVRARRWIRARALSAIGAALNSGRRFRKSSVSTAARRDSISASDSRRSACSGGSAASQAARSRGREIERRVEQRAQSFPVGGGDGHRLVTELRTRCARPKPDIQRSMAASSSRAFSQSRRTVRSVTPSTAAISCSVMPAK